MEFNFFVDDYVLIWSLLFRASISEPIYNLKQRLWDKHKNEYNNTFKDRNLILKDTKNFIPNDDTIYDIVMVSDEYEKIKRSALRYRVSLIKIWNDYKKLIESYINSVLKRPIHSYNVFVLTEDLDVIDVTTSSDSVGTIVIGKKIDINDPTSIIVDIIMEVVKNEVKYDPVCESIGTSVIELAVLNELKTILTKKSHYQELSHIKRCLYPYWLMYLSVPKDEFLSYIARDKISFDSENIAYEKELRKMSMGEFIEFCYRNQKYIIR